MKLTGLQKLLYLLFIVLFLGITSFYGVSLMQTYREYKVFVNHEAKLQKELAQCQQNLNSQEWYVRRFFNDPEFFEWVVRQRLGYARPNDIIFRFEEHS